MESNTSFKYGICVRANCRIPLIHMSNRRIYIEEKNQHINDLFCIYVESALNMNKYFKYQVKTCLIDTFGADTNRHITKTLMKPNTRVLALVIFMSMEISIQ